MLPSRKFPRVSSLVIGIFTVLIMASAAFAADPGIPYPSTSQVSDMQTGSILYYNFYTSNPTMANLQNTRFSLTNTSTTSSAIVHLFFVDGSDCRPSNRFTCLTPNQTTTFLASDLDPGTTGYLVAIAVDQLGCPSAHNFLLGSEFVKTEQGHEASLNADAFSALYNGRAPGCDGSTSIFTILFDGNSSGTTPSYDRVPRVVVASKVPAVANGNDTRLVINRVGGNLLVGAAPIGSLFFLVYDDVEVSHSASLSPISCQLYRRLDNNFPATAPELETVIPSNRTGYLKAWNPVSDVGLLGVILNRNVNVASTPNAFVGGHNLHKLTLSATNSLIIPIFPASGC